MSRIVGNSDYEKELSLHNLLLKNVKYDYEALSSTNESYLWSNTILGVFIKKKAVCEGIAKSVKYLCGRITIPCIVVSGEAVRALPKTSKMEPHAWNLVKIEGVPLHLDVTWDITLSEKELQRCDYFNLSDSNIQLDHSTDLPIPRCNTDDKDYYTKAGYVVSSEWEIMKMICKARLSLKKQITFRVARGWNVSGKRVMECCQSAFQQTMVLPGTLNISFSCNEKQMVYSVCW